MNLSQFHIKIYGLVQGVNFRYNIQNKVKELNLFGYVRNLGDKSVELIVVADDIVINNLLKWIKSSPGNTEVNNIVITKTSKIIKFDKFSILY